MTEKKEWENINKSVKERPQIQEYKNWKELPPIPISFPSEGSIGNTGDWRTFRPIMNEGCNQCGMCWMYCPEGVITRMGNGSFKIDLKYCKGCGICAKECPPKSIKMVRESELK